MFALQYIDKMKKKLKDAKDSLKEIARLSKLKAKKMKASLVNWVDRRLHILPRSQVLSVPLQLILKLLQNVQARLYETS